MPTNQLPDSLASALAAFQASLPAVHKGATGQVPGKRSYKYADLSDLSATVLPLLAAQGLSWMTMPTYDDAGRFVLQYELLHTSGESRKGTYPLPTGTAWEIGSALTYGRRYCLAAITGVAADEDDDGQVAEQSRARPPQVDLADQARAVLKAQCAKKGWDLNRIAAMYESDHEAGLKTETDAERIVAFTASLFDRSDDELKAPAA